MHSRRAMLALALCAFGAVACVPAAEPFPNRPITIVMGATQGGITDVIARAYADAVSRDLGQPVVIDNKPSETGEEAAAFVQQAAPDGYTLLAFQGAQHLALPQMRKVAYEPISGFVPVTTLFTLMNFLAVPGDSATTSVENLLASGRRRGLTFGSSGIGTTSHLTASRMILDVGPFIVPSAVHYAGAAPMIDDLIAGKFDFAFASYAIVKPYLPNRRVRVLALDAAKRWPDMPDLPTLFETGIRQPRVASWFALAAPKDTPDAVVGRLYEAFAKAARDPALMQTLRENGVLPESTTPKQTRDMMVHEAAGMAVLIASLNLH